MAIASRRGSALIMVLWLSAALSAIAFSVANSVRGETERTSTAVDGARAYYLAEGAVERATLYMLWGPSVRNPDGSPRYWDRGMSRLHFSFPGGDAQVEIIPANSRLDINRAPTRDILRLLIALGVEPSRAQLIADGIGDWRSPRRGLSAFDREYLLQEPSFRARHASIEEIEEILLVAGMTPELFYGTYVKDPDGNLVRLAGFRDCVSVYGSIDTFDVNTAEPALLLSVGVSPPAVEEIVRRRQLAPYRNDGELSEVRRFAGNGGGRLRVGGIAIHTIRATARPRLPDGQLSDMQRSVAATVKLMGTDYQPPYQVLRWYENAPAGSFEWQP